MGAEGGVPLRRGHVLRCCDCGKPRRPAVGEAESLFLGPGRVSGKGRTVHAPPCSSLDYVPPVRVASSCSLWSDWPGGAFPGLLSVDLVLRCRRHCYRAHNAVRCYVSCEMGRSSVPFDGRALWGYPGVETETVPGATSADVERHADAGVVAPFCGVKKDAGIPTPMLLVVGRQ